MQAIRERIKSKTTIRTMAVEPCEIDYPSEALTSVRRSKN
jgi:hypothetical protein